MAGPEAKQRECFREGSVVSAAADPSVREGLRTDLWVFKAVTDAGSFSGVVEVKPFPSGFKRGKGELLGPVDSR